MQKGPEARDRDLIKYVSVIVGHAPFETRGLDFANGSCSDTCLTEMFTQELQGIEGTKALLVRYAVSDEDFASVCAQQEGQTGRQRW